MWYFMRCINITSDTLCDLSMSYLMIHYILHNICQMSIAGKLSHITYSGLGQKITFCSHSHTRLLMITFLHLFKTHIIWYVHVSNDIVECWSYYTHGSWHFLCVFISYISLHWNGQTSNMFQCAFPLIAVNYVLFTPYEATFRVM